MKYRLSFAHAILIDNRIVEIIIDEGTHITLEMSEELDSFLVEHFNSNCALIINRLQDFTMAFEAVLHVGSLENLRAAAIVTYDETTQLHYKKMQQQRPQDNLNIKSFSALEMGRVRAIEWLTNQLNLIETK